MLVHSIWRIVFTLYFKCIFIPYHSLETRFWIVVTLSKLLHYADSQVFHLQIGKMISPSQNWLMEGLHGMKVEEVLAGALSPFVPSLWLCPLWLQEFNPALPWLTWLQTPARSWSIRMENARQSPEERGLCVAAGKGSQEGVCLGSEEGHPGWVGKKRFPTSTINF